MKTKLAVVLIGISLVSQSHASIVSQTERDGSAKIIISSDNINPKTKVEYEIDKDSPFNKIQTKYDLKVYTISEKDTLLSNTGVYDNDSILLKINGILNYTASTTTNSSNPVAWLNMNKGMAYVKSIENKVSPGKTTPTHTIPAVASYGFNMTAINIGNDVYQVELSQSKLNEMKTLTIDNDTIGLPNTTTWTTQNSIYLPKGKTARFDSMPYVVNGKEYKDVYLLSTEVKSN